MADAHSQLDTGKSPWPRLRSNKLARVMVGCALTLGGAGKAVAQDEAPEPPPASDGTSEPSAEPAAPPRQPEPTAGWDEAGLPPPPPPRESTEPPPGPEAPQLSASRCGHGEDCRVHGLCTYRDGACIAASDGDCQQSLVCGRDLLCQAYEGRCVGLRPSPPAIDGALAPSVDTERYSTPLMGVGIVLAAGGLIGLLGPGYLGVMKVSFACRDGILHDERQCDDGTALLLVGLLGGGALLGGGTAMAIVGKRKVPVDPATTSRAPALSIGPTGGSLRWSF